MTDKLWARIGRILLKNSPISIILSLAKTQNFYPVPATLVQYKLSYVSHGSHYGPDQAALNTSLRAALKLNLKLSFAEKFFL